MLNYSPGVSASNVAVILNASVTVSGRVPQLEKWYHVSAVAVISVSPIVSTLSDALILAPYGAVTLVGLTAPYVASFVAIVTV